MTDLAHVVLPGTSPDWNPADLQGFRRELEQQRRFCLDQLIDLAYDALAAADDSTSEVTATLMRAGSSALRDIDAALFRLAIGRFGVCQRCGCVIRAERLRTVPMASLCLRCQVLKESANRHLSTPTSPPLPDIVDVWGKDSFPASDPPANW